MLDAVDRVLSVVLPSTFVLGVLVGAGFMLVDFIAGLRRGKTPPPTVPRRIALPMPKARPLFQSSHRKINWDVGP